MLIVNIVHLQAITKDANLANEQLHRMNWSELHFQGTQGQKYKKKSNPLEQKVFKIE